jgi:ParB/RepB/Spo0J family partition protein
MMPYILDIALDHIVPDPDNPRSGEPEGIDELAANIEAVGLLNPINVRVYQPGAEGETVYMVAAGHRRLAAVQKLGWTMVPCTLVKTANRAQLALSENIMRQAMHPVDEYRAFAKMKLEGLSLRKIAKHFSINERTVRQRLALGKIIPEWLDLWRKDKVEEEAAKLLAQIPVERQREVWDTLVGGAEIIDPVDEFDLRNLVGDDRMTPEHQSVRFIGLNAYLKAGGKTDKDLFGEREYIRDPKLVKQLIANFRHAKQIEFEVAGYRKVLWWDDEEAKNIWETRTAKHDAPRTPDEKAKMDVVLSLGHEPGMVVQRWYIDKPIPWELKDALFKVAQHKAQELVDDGMGHQEACDLVSQVIKAIEKPKVLAILTAEASAQASAEVEAAKLIESPRAFAERIKDQAPEIADVILEAEDALDDEPDHEWIKGEEEVDDLEVPEFLRRSPNGPAAAE